MNGVDFIIWCLKFHYCETTIIIINIMIMMRQIIILLVLCFGFSTFFNMLTIVDASRKGGDILILKGGHGGHGCGHIFLKTGHRKKGDILIIGGDCKHEDTHYIPVPYGIGGGYGGGHADPGVYRRKRRSILGKM